MSDVTNFIKDYCLELGITQKELAELVEVSEGTVNRWSSNPNHIPSSMRKMLHLMLENYQLKSQLQKYKEFHAFVKSSSFSPAKDSD